MLPSSSAIFSLQSKLILAFVVIVLVALALAGSVFVFVRRGELEKQKLDHLIAASPIVYSRFSLLQERGAPESLLAEFVDAAAEELDVRILLVDRRRGNIEADSDRVLTGEQLALPLDVLVTAPTRFRPYFSWEPEADSPGSGFIFVSALPNQRSSRFPVPRDDRFWLLLAVPKGTITGAWQGLLPSLGLAAAIALPAAVLLAVILARYITRPLEQLTFASQRMAEGTFDVRVSVDRRDEVGRLAQAFSTMAGRVGEAHSQMRTLVANVSHDLKTPLTSILGFSQALRDADAIDEAEVRRMGGVIHEEASRLATRLNDLLYLSELDSGQALLQREEIDLRRLIEGVVARIEPEVTARGATLHVDLADGVTVSADGPKLERALENLLDNARKYTPADGEIRVRSYVEEGSPDHVCVEVTNAAPDFSPEELPRLFERFYRSDRTRAGAGTSGSGLGLSIARDLIELHGGTLEASLRDREIEFTIRLPIGAPGQASA